MKIKRSHRREVALRVKTTGGTTAQLLGLINALYVCKSTGKKFQIQHFPTTTGTYWPLGLQEILSPTEIMQSKGLSTRFSKKVDVGQYIDDFPLRKKGFNLTKFLYFLQRIGLDIPLRRLRGEIVIRGERRRLDLVNRRTKSISGNYVPIIDDVVFNDLSSRFRSANLPNPFRSRVNLLRGTILIHYRLGDMRKMPSRIPGIGGHGVVDPMVFWEIMRSGRFAVGHYQFGVVSDEPEIAIELLREADIECVNFGKSNVWADLETISRAEVFIGSLSQFSLVGASTVVSKGNTAILPSSVYGQDELGALLSMPGLTFHDYRYLSDSHWLFHR
jgi:hypothetical protein